MSSIATRLKCALGDTGVSQKELSQMTGITEVTISRYVNGNRVPKATTLALIADALGVGMGYFFDPVAKDTNVLANDLISRQAAIDGAVSLRLFDRDVKIVAVDYIKSLPAVQPQRKKGRWISADAIYHGVPFYCSECGENTRDTVMMKPRWNYCPNCGADMRGEQNGLSD